MDYQGFRNRLFEEAEEGYRDFVLGGIITERPLLGVRIPKCRELAVEVLMGKFSEGIVFGGKDDSDEVKIEIAEEFLKNVPVSFEEVMVRGMVIASLPYEEMVQRMYEFIPLIDNWEVCDCFCAAMKKRVWKRREDFLEEIDKMLKSLDEFETRVALVCLLDYYVTADYLPVVFDRITEIGEFLSDGPGEMSVVREKRNEAVADGKTTGDKTMLGERVREVLSWDAYYVKMAVAWLISVCFAKFPEETMLWFRDLRLSTWTYNKAIVKTCESLRVDRDLKKELKKLKQ